MKREGFDKDDYIKDFYLRHVDVHHQQCLDAEDLIHSINKNYGDHQTAIERANFGTKHPCHRRCLYNFCKINTGYCLTNYTFLFHLSRNLRMLHLRE